MADPKYLKNQCDSCGGPLRQAGEHFICDYCGRQYFRINFPEDSHSRNFPNNHSDNPPMRKDSDNNPQRPKLNFIGCLAIFLFIVLLGLFIYSIENNSKKTAPSQTSEEDMFVKKALNYSSIYGAKYIGAFNFSPTIYLGAVLMEATEDDETIFHFYVKNKTNQTIDPDSKLYSFSIESINVRDNLGRNYACSIYDHTDEIEPGNIDHIATVECDTSIIPEVKFINLEVTTDNWGNYSLQIPIESDFENLNINYILYQDNNKFRMNFDFYSKPSQIISLYYDDIVVSDNHGNIFNPSECRGNTVFTHPAFYTELVEDTGSNNFDCDFNQIFPSESTAITIALTIRGTTIVETAPVDSTDTIRFSHKGGEPFQHQ
jgi:hypothetical protein